jgi:endonuclease/exonuclease/phosphatase family metal-dependent hydrolase
VDRGRRRAWGILTKRSATSTAILTIIAAVALALPPPAVARARSAVVRPKLPPTSLTVMEFNIEYGGTLVDLGKVVEAVQTGGASVVCIEEAYGHMRRLARRLGWPYYDPARQIVSQYPIYSPPDGDKTYAYIGVGPGAVAVANAHLPSSPYSPNLILRKGAALKQVLAAENRGRVPQITSVIDAVSGTPSSPVQLGIPTFIAGDFNSPSDLDWTSAMVGARPQIKYAVDWPVTRALEDAGFIDSFRAIHPDPATTPGLTWPAARPKVSGWNPPPDAPQDRIDYIFSSGAATPTDSEVIGEPGSPGVWKSVTPWPSDHRALVSTFDVTPATPPALVSPDVQLATAGDPVTINWLSPAVAPAQMCLQRQGAVFVITNCFVVSGAEGQWSEGLSQAGRYRIKLLDASYNVLASAPLWIQTSGSYPQVGTGKRVYPSGQPIRVWWRNSPGNRWDWVGIYHRGANPHVAWYLDWAYTDATVQGHLILNPDSHGPWPLSPGRYSVYLLIDDSYTKMAAGNFRVR